MSPAAAGALLEREAGGDAGAAPPSPPRRRPGAAERALGLAIAVLLAAGGLVAAERRRAGSGGPPVAGIKPVMQGVVYAHGLPPQEYLPALGGVVVQVPWREVEPEANAPLEGLERLDAALAVARRQAHLGLRVKLRILAGVHAPDWAKSLGGPPIPVQEPVGGREGLVGRFWTPEFGRAYERLQERLAARYDAAGPLVEVTVSRCTTFFAEPFIRQAASPPTVQGLLEAGYTAAADERCQREAIDAHAVWRRTRAGLALNPYQRLEPGAAPTVDLALTEALAAHCRRALGRRCVLQNNSIRWPVLGAGYTRLYEIMARFGPPLTFQTAAKPRVGDWQRTLEWAIAGGASAVEVDRRMLDEPPEVVRAFTERLRANPTG